MVATYLAGLSLRCVSNPLRFAPSVRRRSRSVRKEQGLVGDISGTGQRLPEQGWEESCGREVVVGYMGEGTPLEEKLLLEVLPLQEKSFRTLENPKYFSNT